MKMNDKNLRIIWKTGREKIDEPSVGNEVKPDRYARGTIRMSHIVMKTYLWIYNILLAVSIVFGSLNIAEYRGNPSMLTLEILTVALSGLFLVYGIFLLSRVRRMQSSLNPLNIALKVRIRFFRLHYETWLVMVAFTILMTTFAINSFVDNVGGRYRINDPALYITMESAVFAVVYLLMKLTHLPLIRQLREHLAALEGQMEEG